jgi:hypothetical protein
MKRHLILFAAGFCLSAPLMAQDPSYSGSGYESDNNSRQFNFNPGNMMNRMPNPMRNMFDSSRRGYDDYGYPGAGYPPPAYPPSYGYPGYQAPYPGYAHPYQAPQPYAYPSAVPAPAEPAVPLAPPAPAYDRPSAATQPYQPNASQPDGSGHYRFRPLEGEKMRQSAPVRPSPAEVAAPAYAQPMTPQSYSAARPGTEVQAPISYPDTPLPPPVSTSPKTQAPAGNDPRFRPLNKPGYSSELDQSREDGDFAGNP